MRYLYWGLYTVAALCFLSALYPTAILVFGQVGMGADVVFYLALNLVLIGATSVVLAELIVRYFTGQFKSKARLLLFAGILASPVVLIIVFLMFS
jgi:hypothetical protein